MRLQWDSVWVSKSDYYSNRSSPNLSIFKSKAQQRLVQRENTTHTHTRTHVMSHSTSTENHERCLAFFISIVQQLQTSQTRVLHHSFEPPCHIGLNHVMNHIVVLVQLSQISAVVHQHSENLISAELACRHEWRQVRVVGARFPRHHLVAFFCCLVHRRRRRCRVARDTVVRVRGGVRAPPRECRRPSRGRGDGRRVRVGRHTL